MDYMYLNVKELHFCCKMLNVERLSMLCRLLIIGINLMFWFMWDFNLHRKGLTKHTFACTPVNARLYTD